MQATASWNIPIISRVISMMRLAGAVRMVEFLLAAVHSVSRLVWGQPQEHTGQGHSHTYNQHILQVQTHFKCFSAAWGPSPTQRGDGTQMVTAGRPVGIHEQHPWTALWGLFTATVYVVYKLRKPVYVMVSQSTSTYIWRHTWLMTSWKPRKPFMWLTGESVNIARKPVYVTNAVMCGELARRVCCRTSVPFVQ